MKLLTRAPKQTLQDRLIWQSASLLLACPDDRCAERLDTVERLLNQVTGEAGELLALTAATLRASDPCACGRRLRRNLRPAAVRRCT